MRIPTWHAVSMVLISMVSYHDSRQTENAYTGVFTVRSLVKDFKNKLNLFFGRQLEKGQKNCCENFLNVFFFFNK